jgi:hypothetical protein
MIANESGTPNNNKGKQPPVRIWPDWCLGGALVPWGQVLKYHILSLFTIRLTVV